MGKVITLQQAQQLPPGSQERFWAYNALDATGTREVFDTLFPLLTPATARTYAFERALQAPAMSITARGTLVNTVKRGELITKAKRELRVEENKIAKMPGIADVWDGMEIESGLCPHSTRKDHRHKWPRGIPDGPEKRCEFCGTSRMKPVAFSASSEHQAKHLLYGIHKIPPMLDKKGKVSTDKDILDRIGHKYPEVKHITDAIRTVKDRVKQLGTLQSRLSSANRWHSSVNVGAAWTGRFSSSKSAFGIGGNMQNIAPKHRQIFIPDPGMGMGYADYMRGESHLVSYFSGDERYIEAHDGDTHTFVTRLLWPELPWTGDMALDKKVAKQNPPWDLAEGHDYRFQAKRIQHGGNYGLTPYGIAMIAHIPLVEAKRAYENYMTTFPFVPAWQGWVGTEVENGRPLVNPLGRTVRLFGRPWDKHTVRQGLSFLPQSTLADIENIALWRVWRYMEEKGLELLAQVHDAILHQVVLEKMQELEQEMLALMSIPVPIRDYRGNVRVLTIGVEAAIGMNWGHKSEDNPHGIMEI